MGDTRRCAHCRTPFMPRSLVGRPQLYCSTSCRDAAGRRRRRQPAYFSSATPEWATPQELFDRLDAVHHFTLDVCSTDENAKCERHYTRADDALCQAWEGSCWMNPPYGRGIGAWVAKAYDTARAGHPVVCLLPVRTDTVWWQRFVEPYGEVEFIKGRIKFGGAPTGAPFPSAVVVFRYPFRYLGTANEMGNETGNEP